MKIQKNISFLTKKHSELTSIEMDKLTLEKGIEELNKIAKISGYTLDTIFNEDIELKESVSLKKIKLLGVDIDGVMTDGGMYYTESGDEFKKYNTKDGMAIRALTSSGFTVCILSSGYNKNVIERRAKLLGIERVFVGKGKKIEVLKKWCDELNITMENVAYIGDDINDLQIIAEAGLTACPKDAIGSVKSKTDIILTKEGGRGCVREFIDTYIKETK